MATAIAAPATSSTSQPLTAREAYLALHNPAHDRLSIPFPLRLPLALTLAAISGTVLGLSQGGLVAGLRFRAENAHRQPTTQTGWYLYHKSKNYHVALGGVLEGFKMAGKLGVWVGVFVAMEEGLDRGRAGAVRVWRGVRGVKEEDGLVEGSRDFLSTMLAGLGTAGAFSAWNGFPVATTVRTAKMGAKVGLGFGVAEDVVTRAFVNWVPGTKTACPRIHEVASRKDVTDEHARDWEGAAVERLWGWVHPVATARAFLAAIESAENFEGCEASNFHLPPTALEALSRELAKECFPGAKIKADWGSGIAGFWVRESGRRIKLRGHRGGRTTILSMYGDNTSAATLDETLEDRSGIRSEETQTGTSSRG
ncbi:hypothetical protein B0A55_06809 [Friedmanniomyces simplex]|uniref:Uncharacterized protein n=1 Tax=Friedmanniomyces simplex TaxID=329884 RepID=A0A4U0X709_9PEZI|nr:hypothetical protein B0A55_06809 [Friedmanniomyces simplex]